MPMPFQHYRPYVTVDLRDRTWPDVVLQQAPIWCSTDLRDGNQALVNPMDAARKRRFFALLVELGVKEIEVGFPAASKADFDFCRVLVEEGLIPDDTMIAVLTQACPELIERTYDEAIEGAERAIVHLYNSTSETQRRVVFHLGQDGITRLAVRGTELCKELAAQAGTEIVFQYSPRASTTPSSVRAGDLRGGRGRVGPTPAAKMIVNLPTTVEAFPPNVYADRMEWFIRHFSQGERDPLRPPPQRPGHGRRHGRAGVDGRRRAVEGCLFERRAHGERRPDHPRAEPPDAGPTRASTRASSTRRVGPSRSATAAGASAAPVRR